jgi:hypothetical protein
MFNADDIEVKIKLNTKKSMLAQAQLTIGHLRIIGYRIMKSDFEQGIYVQPPSVKSGSGWLWIVRFDDPELWKNVETKIKSEYLTAVENGEEVSKKNEDFIDPDEIPF